MNKFNLVKDKFFGQIIHLYFLLQQVINHFQNQSNLMCQFIDGNYVKWFQNIINQNDPHKNQTIKQSKLSFEQQYSNFKIHQKQNKTQFKQQAICLLRQISPGIDLFLQMNLSQSQFYIKSKVIKNYSFESIRSKEIRKILIKETSKRSFIGLMENNKLQIQILSGDWYIKTPLYFHQNNSKQMDKKICILVQILVKKNLQALLFYQKIISNLQLSQHKRQKIQQTYKYFTRCTTAPSLSVRSDCAQYASVINRYAASRYDLEELANQHKLTLYQTGKYFKNVELYGFRIKQNNKLKYLLEISLRQKQKIQQQIMIPSFLIAKTKENRYNFNHCYFYNYNYQQKKIAQGGNSQIFVMKAQVHQYTSTAAQIAQQIQKQKDISKYFSKYLIYKNPTDQKSFILNTKKQLVNRQIQIVSYFRGGSCLFLPKYYLNIQKQSPYYNKLFAEYLNGQPLNQFLSLHSDCLSIYTKLYIFLQVLQGLRFVNSHGIVHLDMKQNNIIILKNILCKIFDFGQSYNYTVCGQDHIPKYTKIYASPQVVTAFNGRAFSQKSDVFSVGIMMHNILFGRYPYILSKHKQYVKLNFQKRLRERTFYLPQQHQEYGNKDIIGLIYQLLLKSIDSDETKRPYLDWVTLVLKTCFNIIASQ